jgi:hypothetical protein
VTEDNRSPGSDPIGDFQRWLMRSSAKRMGKELKGQARRAFTGGAPERVDVWEAATAEPLPGEAPECAWCPVCRAARRFRQSGPGLASQVAGAGDALLTVAQDTLAAFEGSLSARPPASGHRPADPHAWQEAAAAAPGGTGWPAEPGAGPTAPGASPTAPGAGPTAPGADQAEPGAGRAESGAGPTATGAGQAEPGAGAAAPGVGPMAPGAGQAEPGAGRAESGAGPTAPGAGQAAPGAGPTAPGAGDADAAASPAVNPETAGSAEAGEAAEGQKA